jgi:hypothetical protein
MTKYLIVEKWRNIECMGTDLMIVIFDPRVPLLQFEYLNKGRVLRAKIFGVFMSHLGLSMDKISSKSVTSIEHVFCLFGRLYRAMAP